MVVDEDSARTLTIDESHIQGKQNKDRLFNEHFERPQKVGSGDNL